MQLVSTELQILRKHCFDYLRRRKILDKGMQCLNEDWVRIVGFFLRGDARKWWVMERSMRLHTWESFKVTFDSQFCLEAFKEAKRV